MPLYKPAPGLTPRDPRWPNARITDAGVEVGPHDFDLQRMVDQGDLVPVDAPAASTPAEEH